MPHGVPIKYTIISGVQSVVAGEVWLSEETHDKITTYHSDVPIAQIIKTVEAPDIIYSDSRPNTVMYVNNTDVDGHGRALRVPVKSFPDGKPSLIKTAFYGSSNIRGEIIWNKGVEP